LPASSYLGIPRERRDSFSRPHVATPRLRQKSPDCPLGQSSYPPDGRCPWGIAAVQWRWEMKLEKGCRGGLSALSPLACLHLISSGPSCNLEGWTAADVGTVALAARRPRLSGACAGILRADLARSRPAHWLRTCVAPLDKMTKKRYSILQMQSISITGPRE
jgi:hypothetical protein